MADSFPSLFSQPSLLRWVPWTATAALLSATGTYAMIHWADKLGVIDQPNDRSSHTRPTPRGGGLAIVAVSGLAVVTLLAAGISPPLGVGYVIAGALLIAIVSGIDDVAALSPRVRLPVHVLAAVIAAAGTGPVEALNLGTFVRLDLGIAGWPLTVIWIVGMTNAFNFMDGIDGIAGLTAVVALAVLGTALHLEGETFSSLLAAAGAAASAGFLVWNWQPARIFMGDVGSASLGFSIAALPLSASSQASSRLLPLTAIVMSPFIVDTTLTMIHRLAKREDITSAHRTHFYQQLVQNGWTHKFTAALYGLAAAVSGATGLYILL